MSLQTVFWPGMPALPPSSTGFSDNPNISSLVLLPGDYPLGAWDTIKGLVMPTQDEVQGIIAAALNLWPAGYSSASYDAAFHLWSHLLKFCISGICSVYEFVLGLGI